MSAQQSKSRIGRPADPGLRDRALESARDGAHAAAVPLLRRAAAVPRQRPEVGFALARSLFNLGDTDAAVSELRRIARSPDPGVRRLALEKIATCIPGASRVSNAQILEARRKWGHLEVADLPSRLPPSTLPRASPGKLRIGYVCAFFAFRNWMKPVWATLDAHDRRSFEVHLFLDGALPDRRHGYAPRRSDVIHRLDHLSNEAAASLVASSGIDVLVDLNAYSCPGRFGLFIRRPAPIQVGWFNSFATSGLDAFDFVIADAATIPKAEERYFSEKILRVGGTYLAFAVRYRVPRVVPPPLTRSGQITFGCLAPHYKVSREVISAFAGILRAVPGARLILRNKTLSNGENRAAILARFLRLGVSADQLILEGRAEHYGFLKTYDRVDIALDTFPYNGGTTTMEALWQGVPVLTFPGDRPVSRVSSSLLRAAGLGGWVCPSLKAFCRRAIGLARSPSTASQLSRLRSSMRTRLLSSPACDVRGLCRQLEDHYRTMAAPGRNLSARSR